MDPFHTALVAGAGVLAGIIASVVGGAAVVVYPVLIATGLTPQYAAVCNLAALMPATMLAALSDHSQLPPFNRSFISLILASVTGAGIGASLLLLTPQRMFAVLMPLLLGFATVLFAFAEPITAYIRARAAGRGDELAFDVISLKILLPVSIYGGYFGAGVGILMLACFRSATGGDYRSANVTKNFVSSLNSLAATVILIAQGTVPWPQTLPLMSGAIVGGLIGAQLARAVPRDFMRMLVVCVGARSPCCSRGGIGFSLRRRRPHDAACSSTRRRAMALSGSASRSITVKWLAPAHRLIARPAPPRRQTSAITRLWRRNSLDSTRPTTASSIRPAGTRHRIGEQLPRALRVSLRS